MELITLLSFTQYAYYGRNWEKLGMIWETFVMLFSRPMLWTDPFKNVHCFDSFRFVSCH